MKLTIERAALLKTLAHVQSAVERRNTIPILSNVLIDVSEGALALTATDMDLTIVDAVPVEMAEPGATTAPMPGCSAKTKRVISWPPMTPKALWNAPRQPLYRRP